MPTRENTIDFSTFEDILSKEHFIKSTLTKQFELSRLLLLMYRSIDIFRSIDMLMEAIEHSNFHLILAQKLNRTVKIKQFSYNKFTTS